MLSGCFQSLDPIGEPERGHIDSRLVGDWTCHSVKPDPESQAALWVIPFDGTQYYVEWREGDEVSRYRAYPSRIGGTVLLNVEEVTFKLTGGWMFFRYKINADGSLKLYLVLDDALHDLKGRAAHREIRRRVADESLFGDFAVCVR